MSEPREQLNRIQRALDSALKTADLIDRAYVAATGEDQPIRLRIASQDVGAVIALLRSAETAIAVRNEVLGQRRTTNRYDASQPIRLPEFMRFAMEDAA